MGLIGRYLALALVGCAGTAPPDSLPDPSGGGGLADVVEVSPSGEPGAYTFAVTVRSPDTGCEQYADWWEVVSDDGLALIHRRVLGHSHVDEQPFSRSGGPVAIDADTPVVVRAHMAPGGYGGAALAGSVSDGFTARDLPSGWGASLEQAAPLPDNCAF